MTYQEQHDAENSEMYVSEAIGHTGTDGLTLGAAGKRADECAAAAAFNCEKRKAPWRTDV